jgi:hypothetical protein
VGVVDGVVGLLVAVARGEGVAWLIVLGAGGVVARGKHECSFVGVEGNMDVHFGSYGGGMVGVGRYER